MGFMQKNVNVFILLLVIVVAVALAGSSLYYQKTFDKITTRYDESQNNLSQCSGNLDNSRLTMERIQTSLNTSTQDIRRYDELYTTKNTELESAKGSLEQTQKDLTTSNLELQNNIALKEKYKRDYEAQLAVSANLQEQTAMLSAQKTQLESSVISYRSQLQQSQDCIDSVMGTYAALITQPMADSLESCK
jgi:chromosome segregation ATPase